MTNKNPRLDALTLLLELFQKGKRLDVLFQTGKDISPLTKAICNGLCRHYFQLQSLAEALVPKPPKELDLWLVLLIGLYQLQFLNTPHYAVVQETVSLVEKIKKPWAKSLVNAVLRRFCRERESLISAIQTKEAYAVNHPDWFVRRLQKDWPNDWLQILKANDSHPPMILRVNQRQTSRNDYLKKLEAAGLRGQALLYSNEAILLGEPCSVETLPGFAEGDVSIQDIAAQLAVSLLSLEPGLRVLDVCAAPGGKTCHILEAEPNLAECLAIDIDERRVKRIQENLNRLHLTAKVQVGDAMIPDTWWDGQLFDRILLDAPCSATGVIRRHPDIKILRKETDVIASSILQAKLLEHIWPLLRTGGMMLYATCSILKEENEKQIADFISKNSDCKVLNDEKPWGHNTGYGWQLFPGEHHGDGFFYSVLLRK